MKDNLALLSASLIAQTKELMLPLRADLEKKSKEESKLGETPQTLTVIAKDNKLNRVDRAMERILTGEQ